MTGMPVRTHGLVHIYRAEGHDVAALSGVDLAVAAGERIALLGPSGAGKSTLLALFGGMLRPSAGRIHVGDHELSGMDEAEIDTFRAGEVGIVLQGAARNHLPWLTVRGNIDFAQEPARRAGRTVPAVDDLLGLLGLTDVADAPLDVLTPGQLQLGALANALAAGPGLLLGDEPTSQLDHDARDVVLGALAEVGSSLGTTIVVVTHDPDVAQAFPRTVTIRDGRVGGEGRSGEEYSVVAADGSLPLPAPALDAFPPGTLLRVHRAEDDTWQLIGDEEE